MVKSLQKNQQKPQTAFARAARAASRYSGHPLASIAFVFFASNADSSYITGEVLTLLGGDIVAA